MKNLKVNWGLPIEMWNYFFSAHFITKIHWFIAQWLRPRRRRDYLWSLRAPPTVERLEDIYESWQPMVERLNYILLMSAHFYYWQIWGFYGIH